MSDIAERLRHHAKYGDGWTRPVAAEAADEIERLRAEVEAARREEREACAAEVDCGCDNREAVLARLESQGEKRASYLCAHHCSALQAAAIRARGDA
jgi:hypothetical protein